MNSMNTNIDQQLYKKYNLTEEEIAYIEKTIKPMQTNAIMKIIYQNHLSYGKIKKNQL
jgi:hypothetical protein